MKERIHQSVYLGLLGLFVIFLPTSKYMTSVVQFLLIIHWLVRPDLLVRLRRAGLSPSLWLVMGLFFIPLAGLFYSADITYGLHDLKIKLPLLILPLVIGTSDKLKPQELKLILLLFVGSVLVASILSIAALLGWIPTDIKDFRDASLFISHIRFALLVDMAFFILSFYALRPKVKNWEVWIYLALVLYFLIFLIFTKALTGLVVLLVVGIFLAFRWIVMHQGLMARWFALVALLTLPVLVSAYIGSEVKSFYTIKDDLSSLDTHTALGNLYWRDTTNHMIENGHYVGIYWCEKELREAWEQRSSIPYEGLDERGHDLKYTLIRYLTSLGHRKDHYGVSQLTDQDIQLIEAGFANANYREKNRFHTRMYEVIWQVDVYKRGGNPSGHSLTQRLEYLKTGWAIFKDHPTFGVGTGDVPEAFAAKYQELQTTLDPKWQLRSHNQWLSFAIAFGWIGSLILALCFFLPGFLHKRYSHYLFLLFILVAFVSMFNEDTLETQAGVAFVAFFYPLFLFSIPDEKAI